MTQVTIVGGGSYQWAPELMADLFATPALAGMRLVLEDIDPRPLPKMEALARKLNDAMGAKATMASRSPRSPSHGTGNRKPNRARLGIVSAMFALPRIGFESHGRRFEAAGYTDIKSFHAVGASFEASVDQNGKLITVTVDPGTGQITNHA